MSDEDISQSDASTKRGLERRVFELEQRMVRIVTITAVTEAKVDGLISTMESRHKASETGQALILSKLEPISQFMSQMAGQKLDTRVEKAEHDITNLEMVRARASGAMSLLQLIGVLGGVALIVDIIKGLKGIL